MTTATLIDIEIIRVKIRGMQQELKLVTEALDRIEHRDKGGCNGKQ